MADKYVYTAAAPPLEPAFFATGPRPAPMLPMVGPNGARLYNPGRTAVRIWMFREEFPGRLQINAGGDRFTVARILEPEETLCHCLGTLTRDSGGGFAEFLPNFGYICGMTGGTDAVLDIYAGPLTDSAYTATGVEIELVDLNQLVRYGGRPDGLNPDLVWPINGPRILLADGFATCASADNPAHIARITYRPATGELTLDTSVCRHLTGAEVCGPGPSPPPVVINAPFRWCGGLGGAVYSKITDPASGALLFSASVVRDVLRPGETEADAEARLAVATIAAVTTREYIETDSGVFYWREESEDSLGSARAIDVTALKHPWAVTPKTGNELHFSGYPEAGDAAELYFKACPTATPSAAQAREFAASTVAVSGLTWQNESFTYGADCAGDPLMVQTGTTTIACGGDIWPIKIFATPSYIDSACSAYVIDDPDFSISLSCAEMPGCDEDFGEPVCGGSRSRVIPTTALLVTWRGMLYRYAGKSSDAFVFADVVIAEAWKLSPCIGVGGLLYTKNVDDTADRSVAYSYTDFSGGTTAVSGVGVGVYSITTASGATYYSGRSNADPAQLF